MQQKSGERIGAIGIRIHKGPGTGRYKTELNKGCDDKWWKIIINYAAGLGHWMGGRLEVGLDEAGWSVYKTREVR
jgi:hypothetical protein